LLWEKAILGVCRELWWILGFYWLKAGFRILSLAFPAGKPNGSGCEIVVTMWSFSAKSWTERGA
jgi:hypothetical protein